MWQSLTATLANTNMMWCTEYISLVLWTTRHSENDNIPQPLNQWMDSPFIGQQVGNCNIDPLLGQCICHALRPKSKPIFHPTLYPTHICSIQSQSTFAFLKYDYWQLNIQGQGHGWGQSWKSQHGSNIQSTDIPSIPCQSGIPFLSYHFFKFDLGDQGSMLWMRSQPKVTMRV